jgi:hypothetical protein
MPFTVAPINEPLLMPVGRIRVVSSPLKLPLANFWRKLGSPLVVMLDRDWMAIE